MATDARKHTVPGAADAPSRQALLDLGLSIRDVVPVADATERAQLVADLTAVNQGPATSRPLFVYRADAGAGREVEYTVNGSTWRSLTADMTSAGSINPVSGFTGNIGWEIRNGIAEIKSDSGGLAGSFPAGNTTVATGIPAALRPAARNARGEAYMSSAQPGGFTVTTAGELIITNQSGATRTSAAFFAHYFV